MRPRPNLEPDPFASALEALLPSNHTLLRIAELIDWNVIETETAELSHPQLGRPAYPPQDLFRMLFLEYYADLSDVELVE